MPGFTNRSARKISNTVKRVANQKRSLVGQRRHIGGVGRSPTGSVPSFTVHQLFPWGFPTDGDVTLSYSIPDPEDDDAVKSADITISWDASASDLKSALSSHPSVHDPDWIEVKDGPWPYSSLWVEFRGQLKSKEIPLPTIDVDGLIGGLFPQVQAMRFWVQ